MTKAVNMPLVATTEQIHHEETLLDLAHEANAYLKSRLHKKKTKEDYVLLPSKYAPLVERLPELNLLSDRASNLATEVTTGSINSPDQLKSIVKKNDEKTLKENSSAIKEEMKPSPIKTTRFEEPSKTDHRDSGEHDDTAKHTPSPSDGEQSTIDASASSGGERVTTRRRAKSRRGDEDENGSDDDNDSVTSGGTSTTHNSSATGNRTQRSRTRNRRPASSVAATPTPSTSTKFTGKVRGLGESTGSPIKDFLIDVLEAVHKHKAEIIFKHPVKESDAPGYSEAISHPIDLSTIKQYIKKDILDDLATLRNLLVLMCQNCRDFNGEGTNYYKYADDFQEWCERQIIEAAKEHNIPLADEADVESAKRFLHKHKRKLEDASDSEIDSPSPSSARRKSLKTSTTGAPPALVTRSRRPKRKNEETAESTAETPRTRAKNTAKRGRR